MIFRLVFKLEISYRVIIFWRISVSFRGFFEDYVCAWWNIWVSIILLCLKILFNVNVKATVWHTPSFSFLFTAAWSVLLPIRVQCWFFDGMKQVFILYSSIERFFTFTKDLWFQLWKSDLILVCCLVTQTKTSD
jgi:hypothetical protein